MMRFTFQYFLAILVVVSIFVVFIAVGSGYLGIVHAAVLSRKNIQRTTKVPAAVDKPTSGTSKQSGGEETSRPPRPNPPAGIPGYWDPNTEVKLKTYCACRCRAGNSWLCPSRLEDGMCPFSWERLVEVAPDVDCSIVAGREYSCAGYDSVTGEVAEWGARTVLTDCMAVIR